MPLLKIRHYLPLAVLLPASAVAAAEGDAAIAECARLASTGERILCLEAAIRRLSSPASATVIPEVDDEVLVAEERQPGPAASAPAPDPTNSASAEAAAAAGESTTAGASTVPMEAATNADPRDELGAEQVASQNGVEQELVRIDASIVEHTLVGAGRLRLTLNNGQVWQQTGDDDDRIARRIRGQTDIAVEMWQSRSGGYRMHLVEANRTLRVRRIR